MEEWRHGLFGTRYWVVNDNYKPRDPVTDADVERFSTAPGPCWNG